MLARHLPEWVFACVLVEPREPPIKEFRTRPGLFRADIRGITVGQELRTGEGQGTAVRLGENSAFQTPDEEP